MLRLSDFETAKTEYYRLRGWDERTGWPTTEKLKELGLSDVANRLSDCKRVIEQKPDENP